MLWLATPTTDVAHHVSVSYPCRLNRCSCGSQCLFTSEEDAIDIRDGRVEPSESPKGTCRYIFDADFLLTHTSCGKRLDRYRSRRCRHSLGRRNGIRRCIRPSQSHSWCHLHHLRELRSMSTILCSKCSPEESMYRKQSPSGKKFSVSTHA